MAYVDGFVIPIKKSKVKEYTKMASMGGKAWMKHGALQYFECIGDDLNPNMEGMKIMTFPKLTKMKKDETVLYSFIIYKSKAHRNAVNARVMKEMKADPKNTEMSMPFDIKRMSYGGFTSIVKF